jgi:hypothetical protein
MIIRIQGACNINSSIYPIGLAQFNFRDDKVNIMPRVGPASLARPGHRCDLIDRNLHRLFRLDNAGR